MVLVVLVVVLYVVVVVVEVELLLVVLNEPLTLPTAGKPPRLTPVGVVPVPVVAAGVPVAGATQTPTPDWLLLFSVVNAFAELVPIKDMIITVDRTTAVTIEPNMTAANIYS